MLKKIEIIIRAEKLELLKQVLSEHSVGGMTIMSVMGCGNQKSAIAGDDFRGLKVVGMNLVPKILVMVVMSEKYVPRLLEDIHTRISEGRVGDGKVFVSPVDSAMRIRTGDRGAAAI